MGQRGCTASLAHCCKRLGILWPPGALPVELLVEAVGLELPVVAVPFINRALLSFPAVREAVRKLSEWGVTMVIEDPLHEPEGDSDPVDHFP
ncbi:hypothetical protein ACQP1G_04585 [Nocardia sp. CA-107356]|uniref:hypothetical protein n=1 Tax=Nocardia sp. CA-107356 TaxID=3239972 RepID=UPI003D8E7DEE